MKKELRRKREVYLKRFAVFFVLANGGGEKNKNKFFRSNFQVVKKTLVRGVLKLRRLHRQTRQKLASVI